MGFEVMPCNAFEMEFKGGESTEHLPQLETQAKNGENGDWRVDPCACDAGDLVEPEDESGSNGHQRMECKKRGEADEHPYGESS